MMIHFKANIWFLINTGMIIRALEYVVRFSSFQLEFYAALDSKISDAQIVELNFNETQLLDSYFVLP